MPEPTNCNLCGARATRPLFELRDYRLQIDERRWTAVRCRRCGLGYLDPRPTPSELAAYYPATYFDQRVGQGERYGRQADHLSSMCPGRLLDVGTARGDFLAVMRDRGWEVEGIEPAAAAGNPYGLTIHRDPFPEVCPLPDRSFDLVTAWAAFEHLRDPLSAFRHCARVLKPGGSLVLQVPNLNSIWARWALQEDVPRHLHFFSPGPLQSYGNRVGLSLRRIVHTTDLFGGSGRGFLRLWSVRASGGSIDDFFDMWRTPRRQRWHRWPLRTAVWSLAALVEAVLLPDWLVRRLRISGQIIVEFEKPTGPEASVDARGRSDS